MKLISLPTFTDKYIWMLHDGHQAQMVDPCAAKRRLEGLPQPGVQLETILVTHHELTGGVEALTYPP